MPEQELLWQVVFSPSRGMMVKKGRDKEGSPNPVTTALISSEPPTLDIHTKTSFKTLGNRPDVARPVLQTAPLHS